MWMLQLVESSKNEAEAHEMFAGLRLQTDFLGGRVLPPAPSKPSWRVQTFHQDVPEARWLPDGVRRVFVMDSQRARLGLS